MESLFESGDEVMNYRGTAGQEMLDILTKRLSNEPVLVRTDNAV